MNPFDLSGPSFLIFYWTLAITCLLAVYALRLSVDVTGAPLATITDPYMLAYLRGGHPEAARVALLLLIDEGVVVAQDRELSLAPEAKGGRPRPTASRPPIEKEIIAFLDRPGTVDSVVNRRLGIDACHAFEDQLEALGYLRPRSRLGRLELVSGGVTALLVLVSLIKIAVALSRGRTNLMFLILSAITAVWLAVRIGRMPNGITTRGKNALDAMEALLDGAKRRLNKASTALRGAELAWIAAAFGFDLFNRLPGSFPFWPALAFAPASRSSAGAMASTAGSSSSWSSCSTTISSCGGGGGGGCGGGGCGGCGGGG